MTVNYTHVTLPYGELPGSYINLGTMLGPFFLAQCFNWALYGVLLLQVYIYYLRFPKDLTYIKVLVYTVLTLDTFFMGCITHSAWQVLVQNWGDVNIFHSLPWTWSMVPIGSGVTSCIVQLFFVWRIWKLSKQYTMPIIIAFFTLSQCAFALKTGEIAIENRSFHYIRDLLPGFWLVGSIIADILTSVTLIRILWKSQTGFKDTDGVVLRLIRLSVEAAAVPVIAATIKLALIYSFHDNRHLVFCVLLGRLYSNSFLAMLNCRDPLFGGGSNPNTMAGAARLSDGPNTVFSLLKSKFTFTGSRGSTGVQSADQFGSFGSYNGNEKIMVHQSVRTHGDVDLERGLGGRISFPQRGSTYSVASDATSCHIVLDDIPESPATAVDRVNAPPVSPGTAVATGDWMMRPYSTAGTFETKSEMVVGNGRGGAGVMKVTLPERAVSRQSQSMDKDMVFPG